MTEAEFIIKASDLCQKPFLFSARGEIGSTR